HDTKDLWGTWLWQRPRDYIAAWQTINDSHRSGAEGREMDHPRRADAKIVGNFIKRSIKGQVSKPAPRAHPAHIAVGREIMIELRRKLLLISNLEAWSIGKLAIHRREAIAGIEIARIERIIREQVQIGLHLLVVEGQHLKRHPGMWDWQG